MIQWAIETRGLSKAFDGDLAVDGLDLTVPEGSVFGLMGPNGAGKSTLVRMLMGILKPTSGSGSILGKSITDSSGIARMNIGYVADLQHLYPFFRVEEMLGFCSRVYPNWDVVRCKTLMKELGLPPQKWIRALSKGMKTQLAVIIALSVRPRLLLLDEPTSGLDPVMKHYLLQLILQEAASGDTTVFFSTHNLHDLERMADRVAVIMKGKLLFNRSMEELKQEARKIQAVFPEGIPDNIKQMPEVLEVQAQGKVYSIIVREHFSEVFDKVKVCQPVFLETVDLGLEELFIRTVGKEGYGHAISLPE